MRIRVITVEGEAFDLGQFQPTDAVDKLKARVLKATGVGIEDQTLLHRGETLDSGSLADFNILSDSKIELLTNTRRYNDPAEAQKLRREASPSHLNSSRSSVPSQSRSGLASSSENINHIQHKRKTAMESLGSAHTAIIGGWPALPRQFPWRVYLDVYFGDQLMMCAGTIIHERWILTAAHCLFTNNVNFRIKKATHVKIWAGSINRRHGIQLPYHRYYIPSEFVPSDNPLDDIALIELVTDIQMSKEICKIGLPPRGSDIPHCLFASGWGITERKETSDILMTYVAEVVEWAGVTSHQFCTNPTKQSVCQGDSGSSLDAFNPKLGWIAFGVVSWGDKNGTSDHLPNVHTRITSYLDWIAEVQAEAAHPLGEEMSPVAQSTCVCF